MRTIKEDGLLRPERQPLGQHTSRFWKEPLLLAEMERVFEACHSCRRCHSQCNSFPTLFDLIDQSSSMDIGGVDRADYWKVVDSCFLCDLCFVSKCPYVPPHEWNIDFPHLMLRAKAIKFRKGGVKWRDRLLSSPHRMGRMASRPLLSRGFNYLGKSPASRYLLDKTLGIHRKAWLPEYSRSNLLQRCIKNRVSTNSSNSADKVAIFTTCYDNYHEPQVGEDLLCILQHNGIEARLVDNAHCCAMPKLELGDLQAVDRAKRANIRQLAALVADGWDIMTLLPSCTLMFKQELPLMFPDDTAVMQVRLAMYDPFEYLMQRYRNGKLSTDFSQSLGNIVYHVACHQRALRVGQQTRKLLELVPDTRVTPVERCSGHDGSYALKTEHYANAVKIGAPIARQVVQQKADNYTSDCPLAGHHIAHILADGSSPVHPISLLRKAYGI